MIGVWCFFHTFFSIFAAVNRNDMTIKEMKMLPVAALEVNEGQIGGVPKNPRFIRNAQFDKLVESLRDAPEMVKFRPLAVFPVGGGKYVTVCGNMRLRALAEIGTEEVQCYVFPEDTPAERLREYAIKDNIAFGENDWDALADDWDKTELEKWGVDFTFLDTAKYDQLAEIGGEMTPPETEQVIKIVVELPKQFADQRDEITEILKSSLADYAVTIK